MINMIRTPKKKKKTLNNDNEIQNICIIFCSLKDATIIPALQELEICQCGQIYKETSKYYTRMW